MDTDSAFTVVIAISDPGASVAARQLVQRHGRFEIVREVANAVLSIDACAVLKPDLLIIADDSPGLRGTEVLGEVRHNSPDTQVLMVATYDASYLRNSDFNLVAATIAVPESISDALDAVADAFDSPEEFTVPERRRTDRRTKQDWSKVFAERRTEDNSRRDVEEIG